jgi:hypothetical protein
VLVDAFHRLARQTGTSRDRDTAAALAAHLRQAVAIDASDQSTTIAILYELERAAPVRKAFLADGHVRAEITKLVRAGEKTEAEVTLRIDPLWHVNGPRPLQDGLTPTRIEGEGGASVAVAYPPAREVTLRFASGPVAVYEGALTLGVTIEGPPGASETSLKLSLQACSDRLCLLPETARLFR